MPEYIPAQEDIRWAKAILKLVKHGGVLGLPTTKLIYLVNHQDRTLSLMSPDVLYDKEAGSINTEMHRRMIVVFGKIGYLVLGEET